MKLEKADVGGGSVISRSTEKKLEPGQLKIDETVSFVDANTESIAQQNARKLIEVAYTVAYEEMPFTKYEKLIHLEQKHGVKFGQTYLNDKKAAEFSACIAETMQQKTQTLVKNSKYFTIFMDGSTDARPRKGAHVYYGCG